MQTYLIKTLRTFDLIRGDDGRVTDRLKALVAEPARRRDLIRELVTTYYGAVVALGQGATHGQLEEVFEHQYGVRGDTKRKAVTFYLNAAHFAGIPLSPHFKMPRASDAPSRPRAATSQRRKQRRTPPVSQTPPAPQPQSMDALRTRYVEMLMQKAETTEELDPELLNRIESLLGFENATASDEG